MSGLQERDLFERSSVPRAVFRLAFPTVIGQIILVLYNMADTFFVGLAGDDAVLAAVTVCSPAFLLLSAISNLFGVGGASVIARALGAGERDRAGYASAFAFWGCLAVSAGYAAGVLLALDPVVDLLGGTNPAVHEGAAAYLLCTVGLGGGITSVGMLLSHLIRAEGRAVQASIGVALGGVLNIGLDPLLMFVLLPPGQEVLGAALATTLSNLISLLYFIAVLLSIRGRSVLSFRPCRSMLRAHIPAGIFGAGLPACVMTLFENVSYAVLDKLMSLSGLEMQAGIGVAKKLNMLAHCLVRGIAQGSLPLLAYTHASGNLPRMRAALRLSHAASIGMAALCTAGSLAFAGPLSGLFLHSRSASLQYAVRFLRILCLGGPFSASAYTYLSFFQAVGEGKRSFLLALLRKGLVDIPLMLLFSGPLPVYGIVLATPIADAVCCLTANRMVHAYRRRDPPALPPAREP